MSTINSSRQPVPDQISQQCDFGGIFLSQVQEYRHHACFGWLCLHCLEWPVLSTAFIVPTSAWQVYLITDTECMPPNHQSCMGHHIHWLSCSFSWRWCSVSNTVWIPLDENGWFRIIYKCCILLWFARKAMAATVYFSIWIVCILHRWHISVNAYALGLKGPPGDLVFESSVCLYVLQSHLC